MAYIDPGSGSMFFQILIATGIGSIIAFRKFILHVATTIRTSFKRSSSDEDR